METHELKQVVEGVCAGFPSVLAVYLFGSRAKGKPNPKDYDIAALFDEGVLGSERNIHDETDRLFCALHNHIKPLDLVAFNLAGVRLADEILRNRVLLYSSDDLKRKEWEITKRFMVWDFMPLHERMTDAAINRLLRG